MSSPDKGFGGKFTASLVYARSLGSHLLLTAGDSLFNRRRIAPQYEDPTFLAKNGQVGWELKRSLAPLGEVIALDRRDTYYCGDLADLDGIRTTISSLCPQVIVNAAAYTAVDKAETDQPGAMRINAHAPKVIAEEAAILGALVVHYSTDYVFDGSGDLPWSEDSQTAPCNVYGFTKLEGERAIIAAGCNHLIFRTSWVYSARGRNFAKSMLSLAQTRENLSIVEDQIGAPTGADLLADVSAHAIVKMFTHPSLGGIYHLSAAGETSWYHYARFVIDCARQYGLDLAVKDIRGIRSSDYVTAAVRPLNSRMDTDKLQKAFSLCLPRWQDGVSRMLAEILVQ